MRYSVAICTLFLAAVLEAGGDAFMRNGIQTASLTRRLVFFLAGTVVLASYGYAVNAPRWDFGKLLGVYVAFFFVVAQLINWIAFHQKPAPAILIGGVLIVSGGLIVSLAN